MAECRTVKGDSTKWLYGVISSRLILPLTEKQASGSSDYEYWYVRLNKEIKLPNITLIWYSVLYNVGSLTIGLRIG